MRPDRIIWLVLFIIVVIIICALIPSSPDSEKKVSSQPIPVQKSSQSVPLKESPSLEKVFESDSEIYQEIENKSLDEAIHILKRKSRLARKIVPGFPKFPELWLEPPTHKGCYASLGERYCIEFLELLFPKHCFKKVRPTWLRNPKTNRCLELDGFCPELMIAVEYNGIQHYVWPNFTGCSREEFLNQRYRDQVKEEICISKNICLIRIPYTVPSEKIPLAIYSKLLDGVPGLDPDYFKS